MKDYAPPWEADESNQPRKREMMHQKGSDMDECAIVDTYDLGCVKEAVKESTLVSVLSDLGGRWDVFFLPEVIA